MRMRIFALFTLAALLLPVGLSAAQLTLRDGTVIFGQFVSGSPRSIVFEDSRGIRTNLQYSTGTGNRFPAGVFGGPLLSCGSHSDPAL